MARSLLHPDLYSSMIIQDANFLASSEIYAYPRAAGALFQHAANAKGGSLRMPERLPGSHPSFAKPGYRLEYTFAEDGKSARISGDIAATEKAPAFRVDPARDLTIFNGEGYVGVLGRVRCRRGSRRGARPGTASA